VDTFHEWLENWLVKRRGFADLTIWRDTTRMQGNTVFDDAIKNAVNESALFLPSMQGMISDPPTAETRRVELVSPIQPQPSGRPARWQPSTYGFSTS